MVARKSVYDTLTCSVGSLIVVISKVGVSEDNVHEHVCVYTWRMNFFMLINFYHNICYEFGVWSLVI